ncbi:TFIID associated protein [Diaporthe sp. PMI_573]|nr:TFIID associated protein [Diaporthaceae sp. PMI_573]
MDVPVGPSAPAASSSTEATNRPRANSFSWLEPHPELAVIFVGPEEVPFGVQKNFLCAKSSFYREKFAGMAEDSYLVRLPHCPVEVFGFVQHFLYTGTVIPNEQHLFPSYEILIGVWKLGHELRIDGLCDITLDAITRVRRATMRIPSAPLMVQVWKDTPEGCSVRRLLIDWAAEYMHTSDSKAEFAKSLPQDVLSELVVAMVPSYTSPGGSDYPKPAQPRRKQVHYIDLDEDDELGSLYKKPRHCGPVPQVPSARKVTVCEPKTQVAAPKPAPRRRSDGAARGDQEFTTAQKLYFCSDLLNRMLGPGYWARLVVPFKEPVDPVIDNAPDYLEKVTKPMDLVTIKNKMDKEQYTSDEEFLADMNQIFANCKTYWDPTDNVYTACETLERTFLNHYSKMNKWLAKLEGEEN